MKRIGTVLLVAAVVAALLAIPLGVAAATNDHDDHPAAPGEQLGGAVGVQAAAVDGELDDRTFGQQIANADSDDARAALIDARLDEIERRIVDHEDRITDLQERREAGEITEGRYQAQLARLEAERANTERTVDRADNTARGLPEDALADRRISIDRIDELRTNARNVGGPETSDAAREIAGENVTTPISGDHPGNDRRAGDRPDSDRGASDRGASDGEAGDHGATEDRPDSEQSTADRDRGVDRGDDQDRDRSERNHENDAGDADRGQDGSGDSGTDSGQDGSSDSNTNRESGGSNSNQYSSP